MAFDARNLRGEMHVVSRINRRVRQRTGVGVTGEALLVADSNQDLDRDRVVASNVSYKLLGTARLLLNEPRQAGRRMAVQALDGLGMRRGLPGLIVEPHLVAGIAEPRLLVDPLERRPTSDECHETDPG